MKVTIGKKNEKQTIASEVNKSIEKKTDMRNGKIKECKPGKLIRKTKIYGSPYFYKASSRECDEADNTLFENGDKFETKSDKFKSIFNKHPANGKIFDIDGHTCKISLISRDVAETCKCNGKMKCVCEKAEKSESKIRYGYVKNNADFEYSVSDDCIKENIVIREKAESYEYDFEIEMNGLYPNVSADGKRLQFIKKETGAVQFYIPTPFMIDAAGVFSESVYFEVSEISSDKIELKVVADKDWINAKDRTFPVIVDPQIVINKLAGSYIYDYSYAGDYPDIFRYETIHGGEVVGEALYISHSDTYYNKECVYECNLIINKSRVKSYLGNNVDFSRIKKVNLWFTVEDRGKPGDFNVNDQWFEAPVGECCADITNLFIDGGTEVVIPFKEQSNRNNGYAKYIFISSPILELEFEDYITKLEIVADPVKGYAYLPGDKFDPEGLILHAKYYSGEIIPIIYPDFTYTPSGSLATYDKKITFYYDEAEVSHELQMYQGGFNDRRPKEGCENLYALQYVNKDTGNPTDNNIYYVRLTLADGAKNENIGTPLNAENLNRNIIVDAEHIYGIIKQENLPDYLKKTMINDNETNNTEPTETVTEEIETAEADDTEETVISTGAEGNSNE